MRLCLVPGGITEITFRQMQYPDGQQDIVLKGPIVGEVFLSSRLNSFADLELILAANSALRWEGAGKVNLWIPYLLGARSDRKFQPGGSSYLRHVIAPIINAARFDSVSLLDPHSTAAIDLIERSTPADLTPFLQFSLRQSEANDPCFICPDKGAHDRARRAAWFAGCSDIVTCDKVREPATGKITATVVPREDFGGRDAIIVDDICDGGRTFIEIAKVLRQRNCGRLFLFVTHGIFSAGVEPLEEYFERICCTNSVRDVNLARVSQFKLF